MENQFSNMDIENILKETPEAYNVFQKMPLSHRNEYIKWINEAKKQETKERRLEKMISMLLDKINKEKTMKTLLKLEYIALFVLGVVMFGESEYQWWWFLVLFFVPDLSMVGYLVNPKIGAMFYNFAHHFGTAVIAFVLGKYLSINELTLAGGILLAHSAFDRILGFGLKYSDDFKNTHLGKIGKK